MTQRMCADAISHGLAWFAESRRAQTENNLSVRPLLPSRERCDSRTPWVKDGMRGHHGAVSGTFLTGYMWLRGIVQFLFLRICKNFRVYNGGQR